MVIEKQTQIRPVTITRLPNYPFTKSASVPLVGVGGRVGIDRGNAITVDEEDQNDENQDKSKRAQREVLAGFAPFCRFHSHRILDAFQIRKGSRLKKHLSLLNLLPLSKLTCRYLQVAFKAYFELGAFIQFHVVTFEEQAGSGT